MCYFELSERQGHFLTPGRGDVEFVFLPWRSSLVQGFIKWFQRQSLNVNQNVSSLDLEVVFHVRIYGRVLDEQRHLGMCGSGGLPLHSVESVSDPRLGSFLERRA